ncbi:hypothetical protein ACHHYP_20094 [Achlya hypogyna]|uniref:Uncharacterized protein n=1 Tax=Achlya hypogyna TaxID=1202772 RepID=A0A1V9Z6W7_ACHHY|nr:hypothetical protein ACHHYP_20094 [Achlya hypogyna]
MGNVCGCGRLPATDDSVDQLLSPRKAYIPPTTSTITRTVLKVSTPRKAAPKPAPHELKPPEKPIVDEQPASEPKEHRHHHHHHSSEASSETRSPTHSSSSPTHAPHLVVESAAATGEEARQDSVASLESSSSSSSSLGLPTSPQHGKKNKKKKAKYGRANYRAGSAKRS